MRNRFPGTCYVCGEVVPTGFGFFEKAPKGSPCKWRVKCVKCTDGRTVKGTDPEVLRAQRLKDEWVNDSSHKVIGKVQDMGSGDAHGR